MGGGAVAAGDMHRLAKMLPDALQEHHKLVVQFDGVRAGAGKLPHPEAGGELAGAVFAQGIFTDRHFHRPFILAILVAGAVDI